jgi:hypothetical protein
MLAVSHDNRDSLFLSKNREGALTGPVRLSSVQHSFTLTLPISKKAWKEYEDFLLEAQRKFAKLPAKCFTN